MAEIHLGELTRGGEVRNLSGHERGVEARRLFKLDELDRLHETVEVVVPDELYAITPSFFQGMFAESVRALGGRDPFLRRYAFDAPGYVLEQLESAIEYSLMKRGPLITKR